MPICETNYSVSEMSSAQPNANVDDIMRVIRERARQNAEKRRNAVSKPDLFAWEGDLSRLRMSLTELREALRRSDEMPPSPPTLRGRVGRIAIAFLSRLMAWQSARARHFQTAAVNTLDEQTRTIESLSALLRTLVKEMEVANQEAVSCRLLVRQETERLQGLLAEETKSREEFAAGCRASLSRLEYSLSRQEEAARRRAADGVRS